MLLLLGAFLGLLSSGKASEDAADVCAGFKVHVYDMPLPPFQLLANQSRISWDIVDPKAPKTDIISCREAFNGTAPAKVPGIYRMECDNIQNLKHSRHHHHALCIDVCNLGMGEPMDARSLWSSKDGTLYNTNPYSLDWFILRYVYNNCYAEEPRDATLFIVPLPIVTIFRGRHSKQILAQEMPMYWTLVKTFLESQKSWKRRDGRDHLIILSKTTQDYHDNHHMGYKLTQFHNGDPFWAHTNFFSTEGPFHPKLVNLPRPTFFHPSTDEDVRRWIEHTSRAERHKKTVLIAGARKARLKLFSACDAAVDACDRISLNGSFHYKDTVALYAQYTYSLQPGGDTPTRRGFEDSLICGTIPIIFGRKKGKKTKIAGKESDRYYHQSYARFFGEDGNDPGWIKRVALVATDEDDAIRQVRETSDERVLEIQRNIREVLPSLLYWDSRGGIDPSTSSEYGPQNAVARALRELREHPYTGEPTGTVLDLL